MAPRGRPRKSLRGQTRMDAALDAMRSYGFEKALISTTVKELLDVYGLDGWRFIEDDSYSVLLEKILEKLQSEAREKSDSLQSDVGDGDGDGDNNKASASKPSSSALAPTCSSEEALAIELQSNVSLDNASMTMIGPISAEPTDGSECFACLTHIGGEENSWKDINIDQGSRKNEMSNAEAKDGGNLHAVDKLMSSSASLQPQEQVDTHPVERRKPCHGWISNSDDELDLVELAPSLLSKMMIAKLLSVTNGSRKRKRRWDIRPQDM